MTTAKPLEETAAARQRLIEQLQQLSKAFQVETGLADDAVRRERSAGPNSLRTGNLTGNFSILGLFLRFSRLIDAEIQWLAAKFPTQRNREFFRPEQGIWQRDQGISGREQGMSRDVFRTSFR